MKKNIFSGLLIIALALTFFYPANISAEENILTMATTTSTENSGLLAYLNPYFEKETNSKVKVIALGTGAAIKCAMDGNADLILVHAKEREEQFVSDGFGLKRYPVMHNDFVLIGPKNDPAGIKGETDAVKALAKIAESGSVFVSRGDDSGTHIKEQYLWGLTGLNMQEIETEITKKGQKKTVKYKKPEGDFYFSIGQGMGNTINFAFEKQGYTLADRGTFIAYRSKIDLVVISENDEKLFNPYGIIAVDPKKYEHVNSDLAQKYIEWITSEETQKLIAEYKIDGEVLFYPDAL